MNQIYSTSTTAAEWQQQCEEWARAGTAFEIAAMGLRYLPFCRDLSAQYGYRYHFQSRDGEFVTIFSPQHCCGQIKAFWGEMAPCDHAVQIYESDSEFLKLLENFIADGLRKGESIIVIATAPHLQTLQSRLGFDLTTLQADDQYIALDAEATLSRFMVNDWPDDERFQQAITAILDRAGKHGRKIRAFGEMVALLWAKGHSGATIRLEHLWNELMKDHQFQLFCAYPKAGFTTDAAESIKQICSTHSKVIPTRIDSTN